MSAQTPQKLKKAQKAKAFLSVAAKPFVTLFDWLSDLFSKPGFVLGLITFCAVSLIVLFAVRNGNVTPSLTLLMISLVFFAAAIANEVISRRRWEEQLSFYLNKLENRLETIEAEGTHHAEENKRLQIAVAGLIHQLKEKSTATEQRGLSEILLQIQKQTQNTSSKKTTAQTTSGQIAKNTADVTSNVGGKKYDLPSFDDTTELEEDGDKLSDAVVSELISTAVRHDRVDVFLQPIVRLPQRKTAFYEVYARLKAKKDSYLSASRYLDLAREGHLVPAIDNMLFMRAIQLIRRQKGTENPSVAYFLNVNADSLNNSALMADLVDFLGDNRHLASKLILEIAQNDFESVNASLWPVLKSLAQMGVRFSMDQIKQLDIDVPKLLNYNVAFVKIDAPMVLDALSSKIGQRAFMNLKKDLDNVGVDVIVQKIETEQQVKEIGDFSIDFGQGYLFGEPEQAQKRPQTPVQKDSGQQAA